MGSEKLLVIGLDGVDFRYLDQFAEDLPHITKIRNQGVEASLRSTHPPWTGSAWPSMYTGQGPSYHGVYDFFNYSDAYPDEATIVSRNDVKAPAIWNYFSEIGLKSIVLNVPMTHPAEEINGVLIPGYLAPSDADGYPNGIRDEISEELGETYRIYSESETNENTNQISDFEALINSRAEAAEYLLRTREWDFAFIQVQKTDTVFHNSSSKQDFKRMYKAADDLIGQIVSISEPDLDVILVSDHGMGPTTGKKIYINEFLSDNEFIETTSDPTNLALSRVKNKDETDSNAVPWLTQLTTVLKKIGVDPVRVYQTAERLGIADRLLYYLPTSVKQSLAEGVDWRESKAYCRRTSEQGIRINLEKRDPDGTVSSEEYDQVRNELIQLLEGLETDSGAPLFELVCPREQVYHGPYTPQACDVLFRTTEMNHEISTNFHGRTMSPINSHNHKKDGVFIARGPTINQQWEKSQMSLIDVAPILFSLLGIPIPNRLDGSIPNGLLSNSSERTSYDDVSYGKDTSYSQDRSEVTDRLEDLGYL
jgi:predicted AlkP superfamily phosphohydrolase/phosphomutase